MKRTLSLTAAVACALTAITFAQDPHNHDHSTTPTAAARVEKDDHDHDHDHADDHDHDHDHGEHADEVTLTPAAIQANGIRIETASLRPLTLTITAPTRLAYNAEAMAHVGALVAGRTKELKARVGDTVQAGDVLAVIDSPELGEAQSVFLQHRTTADTAKPLVDLAQSAYDRAKQLFESTQGITLTEVQQRQRELQTAQAEVRLADAAVTAASNRLRLLGMSDAEIEALSQNGQITPTYTIVAPIAGRITEREVTLGELVGPDKARLFVIADLSDLWALADVPEARLGEISQGAGARITLPALGDSRVEGQVAYISPELDAATRTARVRIVVTNTEELLRPGMFGRADIASRKTSETQVIAISDEAVQIVEGKPAIFVPVEGEPNTFAKRPVDIGPPVNGMRAVFAGLKAGERYVTNGSFVLKAELGKAGAAHEH